jgi:hypothetical protein
MAAPVLAGIPLVYEMLVGAGILAGGAATANKMQKEIQKTIDTNPGIIDEALKNIFMGPARDLINPKMLEEIQNVKPTTTAKGTVKMTMPCKLKLVLKIRECLLSIYTVSKSQVIIYLVHD